MTDIVERLLIVGKLLGKTLAGYRDDDLRSAARGAVDLGELMFDANDEIERLRAEIERLQELLRGVGANRYWEGRWRDAEAEIERLRAALESLTQDPPATLDEPDEDWEVVVKMRAIAREALKVGRTCA